MSTDSAVPPPENVPAHERARNRPHTPESSAGPETVAARPATGAGRGRAVDRDGRWGRRWGLAGVLGLVGMAAGVLAVGAVLLGTAGGSRWLAERLLGLVAGQGMTVTVGRIAGVWTETLTLEDIILRDAAGPWLALDRLALGLNFRAAPLAAAGPEENAKGGSAASSAPAPVPVPASGRGLGLRVEAGRLVLSRLPETGAEAGGSGFADLPALPWGVALERLEVAELVWEGAPAGGPTPTALRISGEGGLTAGGGRAFFRLEAERRDGRDGVAGLAVACAADGRCSAALRSREAADGWLATVLELEGRPALAVTLAAEGSLAGGVVRVLAEGGPMAGLDLEGEVNREGDGRYTLALDGHARLAALIEPPDDIVVEGETRLTMSASFDPRSGRLLIPSLLAVGAFGELDVRGLYETAHDHLALGFELHAPAGSSIPRLDSDLAWDEAWIAGTALGPALTPALHLRFEARQMVTAALRMGRLQAVLDGVPEGPLNRRPARLAVVARGLMEEPVFDDQEVTRLVGTAVPLQARGTLALAGGAMEIAEAVAETRSGRLAAQGTLLRWGRQMDGEARLAEADLDHVLEALDLPADGRQADIRARFAVRLRQSPLATVDLQARLHGVRLHDADIAPYLPADILLDGRVLSLRAGRFRVEQARLTAPEAGFALDLNGNGVRSTFEGDAALTLQAHGIAWKIHGPVRRAARILTLPALTVEESGGAFALSGDFRLDAPAGRVSARLAGPVADWGPLAAALDQQGHGRGRLQVTLPETTAGPVLWQIEAEGQGVRFSAPETPATPWLEGETVTAALALGNPEGARLHLTLRDGRIFGVSLAELDGRGEGGLARASFDVKARTPGGGERPPLSVEAGGVLTQTSRASEPYQGQAHLARAEGRWGNESFRLVGPVDLHFGDLGLSFSAAEARLASGGRIRAEGQMHDTAWKATARLEGMPAAGLAALLLPDPGVLHEPKGMISGEMSLSGTAAKPQAEANFRLSGGGVAETARAGIGVIAASLQVRWREQRLNLNGEARAEGGALVARWEAGLPLIRNEDGVTVPPGGSLQGRVTGNLDLSLLEVLRADSGDRARGALGLEFILAGTPAAPRLSGAATLSNGRFEHRATGAALTRIDGRIEGDGSLLRIATLSGVTPGGGTVRLNGQIRLDAAGNDQLDLHLLAENARLLDTDLLNGVVNADLGIDGTLSHPRLAGTIQVRRAEARIPEKLPDAQIALEVIDIGTPGAASAGSGSAAPSSPASTGSRSGAPPVPPRKPTPVVAGARARVGMAAAPSAPAVPQSSAADPASGMLLAVTVEAERQIFLRGRGVEAELGGHLIITGSTARPEVDGVLTLRRGTVDLLGRPIQLRRGEARFDSGAVLDPWLDLHAEASTASVVADIQVSGRVSAPRIELSADPPLPRDEVLSRILFGKSVNTLSTLETVQLAQSAATLMGIGAGGHLIDTLRDSLGVDRLEVSSRQPIRLNRSRVVIPGTGAANRGGGGDERQTPLLEAGRYLSDNVFVGIEQDLGSQPGRSRTQTGPRAKVEVELTDGVQVEADVGARNDSRIGVRVEWDY